MKFYLTFFLLIFLFLSCKEGQKFDYSLLQGHWLLDSVYSTSQDTMYLENLEKGNVVNTTKYSFSSNMFFITKVDSFTDYNLQFLNKKRRDISSSYFYEIKGDSIKTSVMDYMKFYKGEFVLNRVGFDMKCHELKKGFLILEYYKSLMYFSKINDDSHIKSKKEVLEFMNMSKKERNAFLEKYNNENQ